MGKALELGAVEEVTGEGSTQMRPNHSLEVQLVDACGDEEAVEEGEGVEEVPSLQPNQPGVSQVVLDEVRSREEVGSEEGVVIVGAGEADVDNEELVEVVVVVGSLQPNQPGVSQLVELELEDDDVVVLALPEVVDSSRHPHHPGVLQVSVRVRE